MLRDLQPALGGIGAGQGRPSTRRAVGTAWMVAMMAVMRTMRLWRPWLPLMMTRAPCCDPGRQSPREGLKCAGMGPDGQN